VRSIANPDNGVRPRLLCRGWGTAVLNRFPVAQVGAAFFLLRARNAGPAESADRRTTHRRSVWSPVFAQKKEKERKRRESRVEHSFSRKRSRRRSEPHAKASLAHRTPLVYTWTSDWKLGYNRFVSRKKRAWLCRANPKSLLEPPHAVPDPEARRRRDDAASLLRRQERGVGQRWPSESRPFLDAVSPLPSPRSRPCARDGHGHLTAGSHLPSTEGSAKRGRWRFHAKPLRRRGPARSPGPRSRFPHPVYRRS